MMRLTMMKDFFAFAPSIQEHSLVKDALSKWGYDEESVRFLRASANFVIRFHQDGKEYVLRITDARDRTQQALQAEVDFLLYLADQNAPVNKPLASNAGNWIERLENPLGNFYAVVFDFLGGELFDFEELDESQFSRWGEALGGLHALSKQYRPTSDSTRMTCFHHLDKVRQTLPAHETAAHQELERIESWIAGLAKTESNFGLVHYDFELDNLIWTDSAIQMIDFDSSAYYWYAADLAFALRDLFEDGCDLSNPHFQQFLEGYRKHTDIDDADVHEIPMFLRLHHVLMFTQLLASADLHESDAEEWAVNLQQKLEKKLDSYRHMFA